MIITIDKIEDDYIIAKKCVENFDWSNLYNTLMASASQGDFLRLGMPVEKAVRLLIVELARFFVLKAVQKDYDATMLCASFLVQWAWQQMTSLTDDYAKLCKALVPDRTSQSVFEYAECLGLENFYFWKAAHERYERTLKLYEVTFNEEPLSTVWSATFGFSDSSGSSNPLCSRPRQRTGELYTIENLGNLSVKDLSKLLMDECSAQELVDAQQTFARGKQCLESLVLMLHDHFKRKVLKRKIETIITDSCLTVMKKNTRQCIKSVVPTNHNAESATQLTTL